MEIVDLRDRIGSLLELAYSHPSGRHAETLAGDHSHDLRQTLIVIAGGNVMHDHDSPAEASVHVLRGDLTLTAGEQEIALGEGDFLVLPPVRHGVKAVTDAAFLLTVATRGDR